MKLGPSALPLGGYLSLTMSLRVVEVLVMKQVRFLTGTEQRQTGWNLHPWCNLRCEGAPQGCNMNRLLEMRDLHIWFGATEAVRGIEFDLDDGEVLGLVGESGSGKSATALALMGVLGQAARVTGSIRWRGRGAGTGSAKRGHEEMVELLEQPVHAMRARARSRDDFPGAYARLNPAMTIGRQAAEGVAAHAPSCTRSEAKKRRSRRSRMSRFPMRQRGIANIRTSFRAGNGSGS